MSGDEKPPEIIRRGKVPTPEQARRREEVDRRCQAIQTTRLPQPKSGVWGGQPKAKKQ